MPPPLTLFRVQAIRAVQSRWGGLLPDSILCPSISRSAPLHTRRMAFFNKWPTDDFEGVAIIERDVSGHVLRTWCDQPQRNHPLSAPNLTV